MKDSAVVRFWTRQILVAVVGYLAVSFSHGQIADWDGLLWGAVAAASSAVIGLLGPHEPFVGVKYEAEVPVPPAEPAH